MNLEIILSVMFAAFLVFALVIFCAFMALKKTMDEAISYMKSYTEVITDMYKTSHKYEESLSEDLMEYSDQCEHQNEMYHEFLDIADKICARYTEIETAYKKLLECWKHIDERYDQTYEQFKHLSDELKLLNEKLDKPPELELFDAIEMVCFKCPYDQCLKEDCPVYQMSYGNVESVKE